MQWMNASVPYDIWYAHWSMHLFKWKTALIDNECLNAANECVSALNMVCLCALGACGGRFYDIACAIFPESARTSGKYKLPILYLYLFSYVYMNESVPESVGITSHTAALCWHGLKWICSIILCPGILRHIFLWFLFAFGLTPKLSYKT